MTEIVRSKLTKLIEFIEDINFTPSKDKSDKRILLYSQSKVSKLFKNMLENILLHMDMLGIYGSWKAALFYLITIERLKQQSEEPLVDKILYVISTQLTVIMRMFENAMNGYSEAEKIVLFSTPRMLKLLDIIKNFKQKLCGIIFVQRRITAKILYYVIKALTKSCSSFEHVKPDFMVGLSANFSERDNAEALYNVKMAKRVMRGFIEGDVNLLIASSVVEEG